MTLREQLNRIPPKLCRLMARQRGRKSRPLSHSEIAQRSGLARSTVTKISQMKSWDRLTLDTIDRFSRACSVNLLRLRRDRGFKHLAHGNPRQVTMFQRTLTGLKGAAR